MPIGRLTDATVPSKLNGVVTPVGLRDYAEFMPAGMLLVEEHECTVSRCITTCVKKLIGKPSLNSNLPIADKRQEVYSASTAVPRCEYSCVLNSD